MEALASSISFVLAPPSHTHYISHLFSLRCFASSSSSSSSSYSWDLKVGGGGGGGDGDDDYYAVLEVPRSAPPALLKKAYRRLALQHHPDVSSHPHSHARFLRLSNAYEVLIDKDSRAVYDHHGAAGLKQRVQGIKGAAWEAWNSWDEFKPFKRKTRRGDARVATAGSSDFVTNPPISIQMDENEGLNEVDAKVGDVVEYLLSETSRNQHNDGRIKGVGLVVGRNVDRADRQNLPCECLGLVELEPLFKEHDSDEWLSDPMESAAFGLLSELRVLKSQYDQTNNCWIIEDQLSPGCGSPIYADEIIL